MIAANPVLLASFTTKSDPKKLRVGLVDKEAHKIIDITEAKSEGVGIKNLNQILIG